MADPAPPTPRGQGFGARMSRKVGPLPVWAWAVIVLVVGYFLYKRFGGSSSSSSATGTTPAAAAATPIPASDQSGGGAGTSSGSTGTQTPTDVTSQDRMSNDLQQFALPEGFSAPGPLPGRAFTFGPGGLVPPSNFAENARTFGAPSPVKGFKAI